MMKTALPRRRFARVLLLVFLFFALLIAGLAAYFGTPRGELMAEAKAALQSDAAVTVSREPWIVFTPAAGNVAAGFIIYPGARVKAEAYAPLARRLAQAGSLVVIVPMPLHMALLDIDAATAVIEAYPRVSAWIIGGHSLGGVMAARYAHQNLDKVDGLAMLAAFPEPRFDFRGLDLAVASIYGDLDGVSTVKVVEGSFAKLPAAALKVPIRGGNHAQFGWYGEQRGDLPARISRAQQQDQIFHALLALMRRVSPQAG
jgi:dienelactone hydrolase